MKHGNCTLGFVGPDIALTKENLKQARRPGSPCRPPLNLFLLLIVLSVILTACFTPTVTQDSPRPTSIPTTTVPQPMVQANPSTASAGTIVMVRGLNFKPDEQLVFYLRDASRPTQPILQIGNTQTSPQGTFEWSFTYPSTAPWAGITRVSVIVQSVATKAYLSTELTIVPGLFTPTIMLSTPMLPTVGATATTTATASPPPCSPRFDWSRYIVRPGDTLLLISQITNTSIDVLKRANCLSSDVIYVGQPLFVPGLPPTPIVPPTVPPPPPITPSPTPIVPPTLPPTPTPVPTITPSPIVPPTVPVTSQPPIPTPTARPLVKP